MRGMKASAGNAFGFDRGLEDGIELGLLDIRHADRLRILGVPRPGRMSLDGASVAFGQPAPGDELHDAGIVEEQDRGALAAQCAGDGVERRRIDVVGRCGAKQPVGEPVKRRLLSHPLASDFTARS